MPLPRPSSGQSQQSFVSSFMGNKEMVKEYPDQKQRAAIAYSQFKRKGKLRKVAEKNGIH